MAIYRSEATQAVADLHRRVIARRSEMPLGDQMEERWRTLLKAHRGSDTRCVPMLTSWCRELAGRSVAQVMAFDLEAHHAREATLREHGWAAWNDLEAVAGHRPDTAFEEAVDLLLGGEFEALRHRLDARPELVTARSRYGHGATLLHYCAANGVETERQQTPLNLPNLIRLLLERGAEPNRRAAIYGGSTALELLTSSAHPEAAGVAQECSAILRAAGG